MNAFSIHSWFSVTYRRNVKKSSKALHAFSVLHIISDRLECLHFILTCAYAEYECDGLCYHIQRICLAHWGTFRRRLKVLTCEMYRSHYAMKYCARLAASGHCIVYHAGCWAYTKIVLLRGKCSLGREEIELEQRYDQFATVVLKCLEQVSTREL